jgi:hypothetical protein
MRVPAHFRFDRAVGPTGQVSRLWLGAPWAAGPWSLQRAPAGTQPNGLRVDIMQHAQEGRWRAPGRVRPSAGRIGRPGAGNASAASWVAPCLGPGHDACASRPEATVWGQEGPDPGLDGPRSRGLRVRRNRARRLQARRLQARRIEASGDRGPMTPGLRARRSQGQGRGGCLASGLDASGLDASGGLAGGCLASGLDGSSVPGPRSPARARRPAGPVPGGLLSRCNGPGDWA